MIAVAALDAWDLDAAEVDGFDTFHSQAGEEEKAFSPVQNLLYVADRAIGSA